MSDIKNDLLLQRNLDEVFNERDSNRRRQAIQTLYASAAVFYEGEDKFEGREAISQRFDAVLAPTPPNFTFRPVKTAGRIYDLEQLAWQLGPAGAPPVASGLDVALIRDGQIHSLYTFLDTEE